MADTVARFAEKPELADWESLKRIYHCLVGTCDLSLSYPRLDATSKDISYNDRGSEQSQRSERNIWLRFLIDVSQSSKHRRFVILSLTESKYVPALWLRSLLRLSEEFLGF